MIGQAFPYTPIANPRWMIPSWSFGIREDSVRKSVGEARAAGRRSWWCCSRTTASTSTPSSPRRVEGIDVILTGHTHDALPQPVRVGHTFLIASGSHGKFLSRLDIEVDGDGVQDFSYALIPVLADAIAPDPGIATLIAGIRAAA